MVEGVVRDGRTGSPLSGVRIGDEEADAAGRFRVRTRDDVRVEAPGYCPETVEASSSEEGPVTVNLFPRLEVDDPERVDVGFDRPVSVRVRTRCDPGATLRWRQTSGPALGKERLTTSERGRRLTVRTHPLGALAAGRTRPGPVALDRRGRGDYRLEVSAELGGARVRADVRVVAAAASSGIYQVSTGATLWLGAGERGPHGWTLVSRPEESKAALSSPGARVTGLLPDRFGQYLVRHEGSGVLMSIQAGAYDKIPRDCGRSGCHAREEEGWRPTAHAKTFRHGIEGELGGGFDERCWSCHATGVDPGFDNGGLHQVARSIGLEQPPPGPGRWSELPRQVRRHGSVWCSACHGPGRILPPAFRWEHGAQFGAGVCARCHDAVDDPDAPHRSPHVREWRRSAMASFTRGLAQDDPARREECARCHTAEGYVEWQRKGHTVVPDERVVEPVTCAACHEAHGGERRAALRVLRADDLAVPGGIDDEWGAGMVCATCHGLGGDDADVPHAPQADVIRGRGSRLVRQRVPSVHADVGDGCVGCHMASPAEGFEDRAGGHTFSVMALDGEDAWNPNACASCHEGEPRSLGDGEDWDGDGEAGPLVAEIGGLLAGLRGRWRQRLERLGVTDGCDPPAVAHDVEARDDGMRLVSAEGRPLGDCDGDGRLGEAERGVPLSRLPRAFVDAAWDLMLLERDGSAGVHNPRLARRVLAAADRVLSENEAP